MLPVATSNAALRLPGIWWSAIGDEDWNRTLDPKNVLFIQKLSHKAGAQYCLARVLRKLKERALDPILLISEDGWLTRECQQNGIQVLRTLFPSSRSLYGYIYNNRSFTKRVKEKLDQLGVSPPIVQGNDHPEALRTLAVAEFLNAKSSLMLRTPTMKSEDYFKYRCDRSDLVMVESDQLKEAVKVWDIKKNVIVVNNGLTDEEFLHPKIPTSNPSKVLVLGNPSARKGWQDVIEALWILRDQNDLHPMTLDFTGQKPTWLKTSQNFSRFFLNFIGHHDNFKELTRKYELVINASRGETFGMAALEVIAAGIPLLSSRTGVIEKVVENECLLFEPENPQTLAHAFAKLVTNWKSVDFDLARQQQNIRRQFHIDTTVNCLLAEYGGALC
ncbi:MAG: glycosyltransferase family 4 protein [Deltaproteobacteria bacterium]|nr:glycosyltransferase family 4 protein [Deltaproteobacteria bacterium]